MILSRSLKLINLLLLCSFLASTNVWADREGSMTIERVVKAAGSAVTCAGIIAAVFGGYSGTTELIVAGSAALTVGLALPMVLGEGGPGKPAPHRLDSGTQKPASLEVTDLPVGLRQYFIPKMRPPSRELPKNYDPTDRNINLELLTDWGFWWVPGNRFYRYFPSYAAEVHRELRRRQGVVPQIDLSQYTTEEIKASIERSSREDEIVAPPLPDSPGSTQTPGSRSYSGGDD